MGTRKTREKRGRTCLKRPWKSFPALYHEACLPRAPRSMLSPYYFQAPATKATHEVSCNHCFPHTRSLGFVAWGRNAWPSQNGSSFNTGHVLSSWCFHGIKYIVCTTGFFSPAAGIFGVSRRPKLPWKMVRRALRPSDSENDFGPQPLKGQVHGSAHAHLSKCCFSAGTCCTTSRVRFISAPLILTFWGRLTDRCVFIPITLYSVFRLLIRANKVP